jgi:hypothetical protein
MQNKQSDQDAAGNPDGKSHDIDECIGFLPDYIPNCDFEKILKHWRLGIRVYYYDD